MFIYIIFVLPHSAMQCRLPLLWGSVFDREEHQIGPIQRSTSPNQQSAAKTTLQVVRYSFYTQVAWWNVCKCHFPRNKLYAALSGFEPGTFRSRVHVATTTSNKPHKLQRVASVAEWLARLDYWRSPSFSERAQWSDGWQWVKTCCFSWPGIESLGKALHTHYLTRLRCEWVVLNEMEKWFRTDYWGNKCIIVKRIEHDCKSWKCAI